MMRFCRLTAFWLCVALGLAIFPLSKADETVPQYVVAIATTVPGVTTLGTTASVNDLLMSRLAADERWRLVERGQIELLEKELALSAGGLTAASSAVRGGRMLNADLVVVCRIEEAGDTRGSAFCEVVDSRRASRLFAETVALAERPTGAWLRAPSAGDLERLQQAVERLLVAATTKLTRERGCSVIAPLALTAFTPNVPIETIQRSFLAKLRGRADSFGAVLFDIGSAVSAAQDEALLSSMGVTHNTDENWTRSADVYVWGDVWLPGARGEMTPTTEVRLTLTAWNGNGEPAVLEQEGTWTQLDALLDASVEHVLAQLKGAANPAADARQRVAEALMTARLGCASKQMEKAMIEAAAFFAPLDRRIQEARVEELHSEVAATEAPQDLTQERCRLLRTFWRYPDGNIDIGLIQRHIGWNLQELPEVEALVRSIAHDLDDVPVVELPAARPFLRTVLDRCGSAKESGEARVTMEALWPVLRKFASQDAERGPGRIWPAFEEQVRHLYLESGNATLIARGRALLADVQPDPNRREGGDRVSRHLVDKPKERVGGVFSRSTGKPPAKMPAPSKMPAPPAILPMSAEVKEVRGYVARGVNLLSGEGRGACPFVRAIEEEKWQLVVAMVETGLDVRAEVEWRGTAETVGGLALYAALAAERYDLAKQLVERGVKLRERAGSWSVSGSALYLALRSMDAGLSRAVLQMEPTVDISECPLNAVVDVGDVALLKELLERLRRMAGDQREFREWVDHGGIGKESPLWRATKAGWRDGVEILLAEGANTNPSPVAGRTLRDDAIGAPELAVLLNRRPGAPDNQLAGATAMAMVEKDDPALATLILDAAVLRYRDLRGASVLHFACTKHREAFARRLIAAGASVDAVNVKDCQPLHIAANEGLSDLVGALLAVGAPINHPSSDGVTPLHFAALNGDSATIRCLLKAGADQAYREVGGATPLLMAANSPKALEAMRVFVEAGASLQDVDYWRLGLLERVVFSDDPAAIQFLLDHGVQWRRPWPTKDYVHPLLAAVKNGKPRSVQKLLELGLYDDRALAFAKSGEIRLLLEDASRQLGTRAVDDAELWPKICADLSHGAERAKDHVSRGGNVNYDGGRWSPLWLAVKERNVPLARLLVLSGANRDWYPPGLESSPILGNVINRPPWGGAASEMAVFDAECAELVAMMVTPENAAAYRWTLSSGVHNLLPRTVRALVAAGVPSAEEIEGIRKASWLSEEEKQARLGLFDQ